MSVSPSDFLASAEAMAASGDKNEVMLRNILSRAYYASFHRAREFAPPKIVVSDSTGMHRSYFEQLLQNKSGSIERKIGEKLKSMYGRRIVADYRLEVDIRNDAVPVQLHSSRELFKLVENSAPPSGNVAVMAFQQKKM